MKEAPFRNIVRAVTAAALLTAGCEVSPRPVPTAMPVPTRGLAVRPIETPPPSPAPLPSGTEPAGEPTPKREQKQEEFRREMQTSIGKARILLTSGKDRPENGIYTHLINPDLLQKIKEPYYGYAFVEPPLFRMQVEIHPFYSERRIVVKGRLGRDDEEIPRHSRTFEVLGIDLDSPQLLILTWEGWKFKVFYWGKEDGGKPKDIKA